MAFRPWNFWQGCAEADHLPLFAAILVCEGQIAVTFPGRNRANAEKEASCGMASLLLTH
jgi:hypothetical protein